MLSHTRPALLIAFLGLMLVAFGSPVAQAQQTVGLFLNEPGSQEGYTLFAPIGSSTSYLIDHYGRLVHTWPSADQPNLAAYLLEDGSLLRTAKPSRFEQIDWDGTLLWSFDYDGADFTPHHDIEILPNGNVLMLVQQQLLEAVALQAGRDPALVTESGLNTEYIIEVQQTGPTTGDIVWEWHAWDHLIQDFDVTKDNYGVVEDHSELVDINYADDDRSEWLHFNSIAYHPGFDQIVISSRGLNEIWVIDHSTTTAEAASHAGGNSGLGGDLLYRWGNPAAYRAGTVEDQQLFSQHDAHWIETGLSGEGNILIYSNGTGRPEGNYSTIEEIVPPVDGVGDYTAPTPGTAFGPVSPTWNFTDDPPGEFYSANISGAQRMPNGNTLICEGGSGHYFEVTSDGTKVWDYFLPLNRGNPITQGVPPARNATFRCYRYAADYPGLVGQTLIPGAPLEVNSFTILETAHNPTDPTALEEVNVTTRIGSLIAMNLVELRVDAGGGFVGQPMYDDGLHGDGAAGDNIYGAYIAPQPAGTMVEYSVYAVDTDINAVQDPPSAPTTAYRYTTTAGELSHAALTIIEQQINFPDLTVSVAPTAGNPWDWTASANTGFTGSPSIWFEYANDGTGEANEDHLTATLHWSGVDPSDWGTGADGYFTLTLANGVDGDREYEIQLSVRTLLGDGYTVLAQQTSSDVGISAAGLNGFTFVADLFDWGGSGTPTTSSLTFDGEGRVTGFEFDDALGDENGTFDLTIQDGTRPASEIPGRSLALRQLNTYPILIVDDGTAGNMLFEIVGDTGPWDWLGFSHDLPLSLLSAIDSYSSANLDMTWGTGDLAPEESGTVSFTIQNSDYLSPSVTIDNPITIEALTCCVDRVGDVNASGEDEPTIGDVSVLIDALFISVDWSIIPCLAEADINISGGFDPQQSDITIGDVSYLIDYLFITGASLGLPDCL